MNAYLEHTHKECVYICVCVCVCVRIYVCMYMCMYTYIYYIYITTFSINDTQHSNAPALCWVSHFIHFHAEWYYAECRYAECRGAICTHTHIYIQIHDYIYVYTHSYICIDTLKYVQYVASRENKQPIWLSVHNRHR